MPFVTVVFGANGELLAFENSTFSQDILGSTVIFDGSRQPTSMDGLEYAATTFGAATVDGTGGVDEWVVENHPTAGRVQIRSLTAAIETTDFNNPSIELQINLGADADSLTIEALDSAFNAALTVDAGIGDDEITINAITGGGTYTIDSGDVIINDPLILHDNTILRSIGGNITITFG